MTRRIVHVVSNIDRYTQSERPTGIWLSELSHAYDLFAEQGYEQQIVSPKGGLSPLEPKSLKWPNADSSTKRWLNDPAAMNLLAHTLSPTELKAEDYHAIYFTGGHAVMYDYPENEDLQRLTRDIYEAGGLVATVCHGYCGVLNTRLSDGSLLIKGKSITGFSWVEEILAGVAKYVPYNIEAEIKGRGAMYEKALVPFTSNVVVDGRLISGQNPQSAKATAKKVVAMLT